MTEARNPSAALPLVLFALLVCALVYEIATFPAAPATPITQEAD